MTVAAGEVQEISGDAPVALYRLYDESGALLYVGVTVHLASRFRQHRAERSWWHLVARKTVQWCPGRDEALAAEALAIDGECPRFNVMPGSLPVEPEVRGTAKTSAQRQSACRAGLRKRLAGLEAQNSALRADIADLREQVAKHRLVMPCPHPAGSVEDGVCGVCGEEQW